MQPWDWGACKAMGSQLGIGPDSPGPQPRWCVVRTYQEESGVLWGGQLWAGMCVSAAMMSGQGLGRERLKAATTGQSMCRKAFLALWLVFQAVLSGVQGVGRP